MFVFFLYLLLLYHHCTVPAEIVEEWSSNDVTAQEGDSVWLHCNVTGVPPPNVVWHRRSVSGRDVHDCRQRTVDAGTKTISEVVLRESVKALDFRWRSAFLLLFRVYKTTCVFVFVFMCNVVTLLII